jgi:hypothetical protein
MKMLGHRYQQVKDIEDDPKVPPEPFFSRVSRLEMDYLHAPALTSFGTVMFAGVGIGLPDLIAAGSGALVGAVLGASCMSITRCVFGRSLNVVDRSSG